MERARVSHDQTPSYPVPLGHAGRPPARRAGADGWLVPAALGTGALGAAALYNVAEARAAERENPPVGRFVGVDGVRLHYFERGQGEAVVLLHGNGSLAQEFAISGLVDRLADRYRVIVFDRPGYGYSERPGRLWTAERQAALLTRALERIGADQAIVLGHSWGTLVAVAMGFASPGFVRALVLASGYYFPTARLDVALFAPPAIPIVGDVARYTVSPFVARLILPRMIRRLFAPAEVPERFRRLFPRRMVVRPFQLKASGEESALMIPAAMRFARRYADLAMPVVIVAGEDDRFVDTKAQSERLHHQVPGSAFIPLAGLGHMVHHLAPGIVAAAVDRAAHMAEAEGERLQSPASPSFIGWGEGGVVPERSGA